MEDSTSSRKRKVGVRSSLVVDNNNDNNTSCSNDASVPSNPDSIQSPSTIESLLAVPLNVIFREIPSSNKVSPTKGSTTSKQGGKPLLTRAEAKCLLQVTMLAQEMDCLVQTSTEILSQRKWCRSFGQKLLQQQHQTNVDHGTTTTCCNPFLRPLLPILILQGSWMTSTALEKIQDQLSRILVRLSQCRQSLRQFSEQNWTLSESLLEALDNGSGSGGNNESQEEKIMDWMESSQLLLLPENTELPKGAVLAREKRRLSDLQEEVCSRIDSLLGQADACSSSVDENTECSQSQNSQSQRDAEDEIKKDEISTNGTMTMVDICARLWNLSDSSFHSATIAATAAAAAVDKNDAQSKSSSQKNSSQSQSQQQQQQQQKVALFSYPETIQGLDQRMQKQQQQQQNPEESMTMDALDNQSKPQGIPGSSAELPDDLIEESDDDDVDDDDDDDDRVGKDDHMQVEDKVESADSQRSVISNNSNELHQQQNDTTEESNTEDGQRELPARLGAPPTHSQANTLLSFAFQH